MCFMRLATTQFEEPLGETTHPGNQNLLRGRLVHTTFPIVPVLFWPSWLLLASNANAGYSVMNPECS